MSYIHAVESRDVFVVAGAAAVAVALGCVYAKLRNDSAGRIVGHCDDGTVIGLFEQGLRRRPGRSGKDYERLLASYPDTIAGTNLSYLHDDLRVGDLSFAVLRHGERGELLPQQLSGFDVPWIVEGLDRRGETIAITWGFERESEAREVLAHLNQRIVRPMRDETGRAVPMTESDLAAVRGREHVARTGGPATPSA